MGTSTIRHTQAVINVLFPVVQPNCLIRYMATHRHFKLSPFRTFSVSNMRDFDRLLSNAAGAVGYCCARTPDGSETRLDRLAGQWFKRTPVRALARHHL
ncbi:hypothetical protein BDW22DRAFT_1359275 [Trametopsis cervina]|nr:hypothetical protein BDW22DRAFT_1359275 [Trametopsis cervina]